MIRTAICDDDPAARAYLAELVGSQGVPCEITEYASAEECLTDRREVDLYLLDVELEAPGPDGMALARRLRERRPGPLPVIIFVTGYDRYVFDAFDVGAFQYLLKPVDGEKFARVFSRAAAQVEAAGARPARVLTLQSGGAARTIPLDGIYYVESSNHKVILRLKDGEFACYARLRDLEDQLRDRFFRIHKGYLVNLAYVDGYSRTEVTLTNGETLLLSKYKYRDFVKAYLRFLQRGAGL